MIDDNGPGAVTLGANDRALAVAATKALLRVSSSDEDALIAAFVESALGLAEQFTGQLMIVRTLRAALRDGTTAWQRLDAAPVRAITAVETPNVLGFGLPLASARFAIDIDAAGDGWVRLLDRDTGAVQAVLDAGLASGWAGLPAPLRQGVVLLAAFLFDTRDASAAPPAAITALWRPFRRVALRPADRPC